MNDNSFDPDMKSEHVAGLLGLLLGIFAIINIVLVASTGSTWP